MAFQIVLNLIIAFVWMFLNNAWNGIGFLVGFMLGLLLIGGMRRFFPQRFYVVRVWAIFKLIGLLFKELVRASIEVIRDYQTKASYSPRYFHLSHTVILRLGSDPAVSADLIDAGFTTA